MPEVNRIYVGDALEMMRTWPDAFVQTVVSSPPTSQWLKNGLAWNWPR